MADVRLLRRLDQVAGRLARLRFLRTLAIGWAMLAAAVIVGDWRPEWIVPLRWLLPVGIPAVFVLAFVVGRRVSGDRVRAAQLIERTFPQFESRLITALQQRPQGNDWGFGFLQTELLTEVFTRLGKVDLRRPVPSSRLWGAQLAHLAALACLVFAAAGNLRTVPPTTIAVAEQAAPSPTSIAEAATVHVEPGDAEVERGSSVVVIARFDGPLPETVRLVAVNDDGEKIEVPLKKSLHDPVFGGRLATVEENLKYRIEFDARTSDEFALEVFDYPALLKADADVAFPEYTGLPAKSIEDIRKLSVVEGSTVSLNCSWNKPLAKAELVDDEGRRYPLAAADGEAALSSLTWNAAEPGKNRFRLELIDREGRANKVVPELEITVVANRPPDLKVAFPGKDVRVSPLQELAMAATATDDFGLRNLGIVVETPDGAERSVALLESDSETLPASGTQAQAEHLLPFEELQARPNDLVSYYFYAEDVGPDGRPRRTVSDMFFAEVRPFEEIFRQVPPQPGGEQQQQQQQQQQGESGQLLELQRQIVTGSWNVLRRERDDDLSTRFDADLGVLLESQEQVRELTVEMAESVEDELMKQYAAAAVEHMGEAIDRFTAATADDSLPKLREARNSAQAAYRDLLQLQTREKNVQNSQSQSRSQSRSQNSQERMNQQLQALQLKNDRDRYETERQAQSQQEQANQETLNVLNQLRDLARRQEDLNEKIRELENALRNAQTEEEKEDLARRLKRLQEEQEDLLRDLDDVRDQMNNDTNRQRMADAREQVDQTRERVLRASEALQQGQTSRALTEGARAERQLEQVKEELRQQASGQFDDAVRQLRDEVRDLADKERNIAEKLAGKAPEDATDGETAPKTPSLRPEQPENHGETAEELQKQKERLTEILDRTRNLVEESETSEPLLSNSLYDAMRELRTFQPEEALENAARLTRYGVLPEAQKLEEQAREGINRLAEGVEQAARGILGNEDEALQLAQSELNTLAESIRQELERNQPGSTRSEPSGSDSPKPSAQSGNQPGEQPGDPMRGEPAAAEPMPGDSATPGTGQRPADSEAAQAPGDQPSARPGQPGLPATPPPGERPEATTAPGRTPMPGDRPEDPMNGRSEGNQPMPGEPGTPAPGDTENAPREETAPGTRPAGPSRAQGEAGQPDRETAPQPGQQPGSSGSPGQSPMPGSPTGEPTNGTPSGEPMPGEGEAGGPMPGRTPSPGQRSQSGGNLAESLGSLLQEGGDPNGGGAFGPHNGPMDPLTGESFREWSERLRDVEEMLSSPDLKARAAEIRDRARQVRTEVKRHSQQPNWELVRTSIYGPLLELEQLVAEDLARRDPNERAVPIDRDPVPDRYSELVRRYYEELSRQRSRSAAAP